MSASGTRINWSLSSTTVPQSCHLLNAQATGLSAPLSPAYVRHPSPPRLVMGEACCLPRARLPSDTLRRNTLTGLHKNTLPGIHQGPLSRRALASRLRADIPAGDRVGSQEARTGTGTATLRIQEQKSPGHAGPASCSRKRKQIALGSHRGLQDTLCEMCR